MSNSHRFPGNFREITANPFVSKNGPISTAGRGSKFAKFRGSLPVRRRQEKLQQMRHFSPTVALEMVIAVNVKFSTIRQKFRGNRGQSICLQKWARSVSNRGSKLAKFRGKSGPQEDAGNDAEMGHFRPRVAFGMVIVVNVKVPMISQKFRGVVASPFVSKNGPFR